MKRNIFNIVFIVSLAFLVSSCFDKNEPVWTGSVVEIDAAVYNSRVAGLTYPRLTRVPQIYGRPVRTAAGTLPDGTVVPADPLLTRASGNIVLRVNLVGKPLGTDQVIPFDVYTADDANNTNPIAVEGVHYNVTRQLVIPAGENFGFLGVEIINPGATTGSRDVVFELGGNSMVSPSQNYKRIALRIAQN
jgi:hypothetical protein